MNESIITEDYISFETAKLLKEKGFSVPSLNYKDWMCCMYDENGKIRWGSYDSNWYARITLQMAMKWLRDFHKIYIDISTTYSEVEKTMHYIWQIFNSEYDGIGDCEIFYGKYEDACEASIKYCLENLENLRSVY